MYCVIYLCFVYVFYSEWPWKIELALNRMNEKTQTHCAGTHTDTIGVATATSSTEQPI